MSFKGKIGLVTGAASGMGKIIANRMAKQGMQVATIDLNINQLKEDAKSSNNLIPFYCDISSFSEVNDLVAQVSKGLGSVDCLVNAAAIMPAKPILLSDPTSTMKLMEINFGGTVNLVHTVVSEMIKKDSGQAIFFGSIAGHVLNTGLGPYSSTKSAVNSYIEILQHEISSSNTHLMLVEPNMVDTPLIDNALGDDCPKNITLSKEKGRLSDPNKIIDSIEKGLKNKVQILLPNAEAKILTYARRFTPNLLWKLIEKSNI